MSSGINKIKNFSKKQKIYNLTQSNSILRQNYCISVEYTHYRLEIMKIIRYVT